MSSQLRVDKIVPVDGAPTGGGGGIIQIKQTFLNTATSTTTSGSFTDISGMSVSITPKFNTSKIFVMITLGSISSAAGISVGFRLLRDSTAVGNAADTTLQSGFTNIYEGGNSSLFSASHNFLDTNPYQLSPKLQVVLFDYILSNL